MKKTHMAAALAIAAFAGWSFVTYPRIGQLTYDIGGTLEARAYGLHKEIVTVDGIPMTIYRSHSEGPAILMIHGFSADKNVWPRFARHFTADHQVVIPDLPGHGETGFNPQWSYTIQAQTDRMAHLLDAIHIQKAHVIGNSMGGAITARFAVAYPERALSIGLLDPAGLPSPHPSEMRQMMAQGRNPFFIDSREAFYRFYPMTMASPPWMPGYVLDAVADDYIRRKPQLEVIFKESHPDVDPGPELKGVKLPTLLLWGKEDRLIDVSSVPVWQAALPHAQVAVWDGIGHMPMVERPAESAALYKTFISRP